jgi:hypothetical protein
MTLIENELLLQEDDMPFELIIPKRVQQHGFKPGCSCASCEYVGTCPSLTPRRAKQIIDYARDSTIKGSWTDQLQKHATPEEWEYLLRRIERLGLTRRYMEIADILVEMVGSMRDREELPFKRTRSPVNVGAR